MAKARDLYTGIMDAGNLIEAAYRAARGKYARENVVAWMRDLADNLSLIRTRLEDQTWRPSAYKQFFIRSPKQRVISAAPFADRVVHHAVCQIILPILEKSLVPQTCSNRIVYGTHHAVDLCQRYLRRFDWYLKCDIKQFFPSIDHAILKALIRKRIACRDTLALIDSLIDSGGGMDDVTGRRVGLPLGNLTSQHFANLFLSPLDHFVIQRLHARGYVRYVDDFVIFGNSPAHLAEMRDKVQAYLETLNLSIHTTRALPRPEKDGITFLGYRVFREYRRVTRDNVIRARRRIRLRYRQYHDGLIDTRQLKSSLFAWVGHARQADAWPIIRRLLAGKMHTKSHCRV